MIEIKDLNFEDILPNNLIAIENLEYELKEYKQIIENIKKVVPRIDNFYGSYERRFDHYRKIYDDVRNIIYKY